MIPDQSCETRQRSDFRYWQLRAQGLEASDIDHIELGTSAPVLRTIAEPIEDKRKPKSGYHAKFSGPYTVAAALVGGGGLGVYLDDFVDGVWDDPARLALAHKVEVVADARATDLFPKAFAAVLRVKSKGGSTLEARVDGSRGSDVAPLSREDMLTKFRLNASRALDADRVAQLESVSALTSNEDLAQMLKLIQQ